MAFLSGGHLSGGIEVVCGPMFSGKTEELIRRVRRAQIAKLKAQIFKPTIDDRYDAKQVVSHSRQGIDATPVASSLELVQRVMDSTRLVAIDEVQFFDDDIVIAVNKLARQGKLVICAGLDQDFRGRPFGKMPELLAIADRVDKVSAVCTICGTQATKTYRAESESSGQVLVGEADVYQARCRMHFDYHHEEQEFGHFHKINSNEAQALESNSL